MTGAVRVSIRRNQVDRRALGRERQIESRVEWEFPFNRHARIGIIMAMSSASALWVVHPVGGTDCSRTFSCIRSLIRMAGIV